MFFTHPINPAMRQGTRRRHLCTLLATPLWVVLTPTFATQDAPADAASKSWAGQAAAPAHAVRDHDSTTLAAQHVTRGQADTQIGDPHRASPHVGRPIADAATARAADALGSAAEPANYALMLGGLVAVGAFMWRRHRD